MLNPVALFIQLALDELDLLGLVRPLPFQGIALRLQVGILRPLDGRLRLGQAYLEVADLGLDVRSLLLGLGLPERLLHHLLF